MSDTRYTAGRSVSGWVGWIVFAATVMMIGGVCAIISGLAGIFRDEVYWATGGGELLVFDYTAWGWIHLIFGIALLIVGTMLLGGSAFARVVAILLVGLNLVAQFTWLNATPWWSIVMITLDLLVLYALAIHGGELRELS
jgi:hypothetical protein